jgi:hypothetical protein
MQTHFLPAGSGSPVFSTARRPVCASIGQTLVLVACLVGPVRAELSVIVTDPGFDTAATMLAYTEFELSGEPLAESLGLDLDLLDPNAIDQPTVFDYSAGIESYEYSEEGMYALNYQSRLGPHLANGIRNQERGGDLAALSKRFVELAASVAYPIEELPLNLYPISLPYRAGSPAFGQAVDTRIVDREPIEFTDAQGRSSRNTALTPAYLRDYKTLAWDPAGTDYTLSPAALGGILLKEVMWAQDFLGGMHVLETGAEVEATSTTMDQDGKHALGVSSVDGLNGVILTELSLDKLRYLAQGLAFDGHDLGVAVPVNYQPADKAIWFPHAIKAVPTQRQGVNALGTLRVTDSSSRLRDLWMLLWPLSEMLAFTDQRQANSAVNPAFAAVFDGAPFAAAPISNTDADPANDVPATDAFSLVSRLSDLVFRNLDHFHFDPKAQTLVDRYDGQRGQRISTYDAAYSMVALAIFQRAQDALPVGYASAVQGRVALNTAQGRRALALIRTQADFLLDRLTGENGLLFDGLHLDGKIDATQSIDVQFAGIRGLTAAFVATGESKYRLAARALYVSIEAHLFNAQAGTWLQAQGSTRQTPWTAAAISGGLRDTIVHLKNTESETAPALSLATLVQRYQDWFRRVINGPAIDQGMQLAEWPGDSGELVLERGHADNDNDRVPQITHAGGTHGRAMVLAREVTLSLSKP